MGLPSWVYGEGEWEDKGIFLRNRRTGEIRPKGIAGGLPGLGKVETPDTSALSVAREALGLAGATAVNQSTGTARLPSLLLRGTEEMGRRVGDALDPAGRRERAEDFSRLALDSSPSARLVREGIESQRGAREMQLDPLAPAAAMTQGWEEEARERLAGATSGMPTVAAVGVHQLATMAGMAVDPTIGGGSGSVARELTEEVAGAAPAKIRSLASRVLPGEDISERFSSFLRGKGIADPDLYHDLSEAAQKALDREFLAVDAGPQGGSWGRFLSRQGLKPDDYAALPPLERARLEGEFRQSLPKTSQDAPGRPISTAPDALPTSALERAAGGVAARPEVVRPPGWKASNDAPYEWTRPGHFYRGMEQAEYDATLGSGKGILSRRDYSLDGEGTSFSHHAADAESYVNFGRSDPRVTGKPNYLVEIEGDAGLARDRDGYFKAAEEIPPGRITRAWRFDPAPDDSVVAVPIRPQGASLPGVNPEAGFIRLGPGGPETPPDPVLAGFHSEVFGREAKATAGEKLEALGGRLQKEMVEAYTPLLKVARRFGPVAEDEIEVAIQRTRSASHTQMNPVLRFTEEYDPLANGGRGDWIKTGGPLTEVTGKLSPSDRIELESILAAGSQVEFAARKVAAEAEAVAFTAQQQAQRNMLRLLGNEQRRELRGLSREARALRAEELVAARRKARVTGQLDVLERLRRQALRRGIEVPGSGMARREAQAWASGIEAEGAAAAAADTEGALRRGIGELSREEIARHRRRLALAKPPDIPDLRLEIDPVRTAQAREVMRHAEETGLLRKYDELLGAASADRRSRIYPTEEGDGFWVDHGNGRREDVRVGDSWENDAESGLPRDFEISSLGDARRQAGAQVEQLPGTGYRGWADRAWLRPAVGAGFLTEADRLAILQKNQMYSLFQQVDTLARSKGIDMTAGEAPNVPRFLKNAPPSVIHGVRKNPLEMRMAGLSEGRQIAPVLEASAIQAARFQRLVDRQLVKNKLADLVEQSPDLVPEIVRTTDPMAPGSFVAFKGGEKIYLQAPPDLLENLDRLTAQQAAFALEVAQKATGALRVAATTYTPGFPFGNVARDVQRGWITSQHGMLPGEPLYTMGKEVVHRLFNKFEPSAMWREFDEGVASYSTFVKADSDGVNRAMQEAAREVTAGSPSARRIVDLVNPITWLRELGQFKEAATRVTEKGLARRGGREWFRGQRNPGHVGPRTRTESDLDAARVSLNFMSGGSATREGNRYYAFMNAMALDAADFFRQVSGPRKYTVIAKATAGITLPALYEVWHYRNDPEFRNLPWWDRSMFWHLGKVGEAIPEGSEVLPDGRIQTPAGEIMPPRTFWDGTWRRIPRPPGLFNLVFGILPSLAFEAAMDSNPKAAEEAIAGLVEQTPMQYLLDYDEPTGNLNANLFPLVPDALRPPLEAGTNLKGFPFGQAIDPRGTEKADPALRWNEQTPLWARELSERSAPGAYQGSVSPNRIQRVVEGYGAGAAKAAGGLVDRTLLAGGQDPNRDPYADSQEPLTPRDVPFLRSFMGSPAQGPGSAPVKEFWARYDTARQSSDVLKGWEDAGRIDMARKALEAHPELRYKRDLESTAERLRELGKQRKEILAAPFHILGPEQKRAYLELVDQGMTQAAGQLLLYIQQQELARQGGGG